MAFARSTSFFWTSLMSRCIADINPCCACSCEATGLATARTRAANKMWADRWGRRTGDSACGKGNSSDVRAYGLGPRTATQRRRKTPLLAHCPVLTSGLYRILFSGYVETPAKGVSSQQVFGSSEHPGALRSGPMGPPTSASTVSTETRGGSGQPDRSRFGSTKRRDSRKARRTTQHRGIVRVGP